MPLLVFIVYVLYDRLLCKTDIIYSMFLNSGIGVFVALIVIRKTIVDVVSIWCIFIVID